MEGDYDLAFGYNFPWYSQDENLVGEFIPYYKLGGLVHTAVHLYFMRVHAWSDFIGLQLNLAIFQVLMDVLAYRHFCYGIFSSSTVGRVKVNLEFEFSECFFGLFGVFLEDGLECKWTKYYIELPIINEGISTYDTEWTFLPQNCIVGDGVSLYELFN